MNFGKGMPWLFRYLKERLLYKNWNASTITPWPFAGTCVITQRIIITHRPGFIMMVWIHSGFCVICRRFFDGVFFGSQNWTRWM